MASFRLIQESTIVQNNISIDKDEALDEVQAEINDLLPSWDQSRIEVKSKTLKDIEMEEGELSGEELHDVNSAKSLRRKDTPDFNYGRRQPIQITIQNKDAAKLPDLLQEIGGHEVTGIDRDVTEKMEARAKRFNLQAAGSNIHYEDMVELYKSLGISEAEIEGQTPKSERQYRLEAIHIRGFDGSIVSSEDIHEYFSEFSPVSFEWVDKNSANVIWALPSSAAKALLTLSRPLKEDSLGAHNENTSQYDEKMAEDDEMINMKKADEDIDQIDAPESSNVEEESTRLKKQKIKEKILEKFSFEHNSSINVSEVGIDVPIYADVEQWRIGRPSEKLGITIFMRIATRHDTVMNDGPAAGGDTPHLSFEALRQKNIKLKTTGGIISNSRKRKLQEVMLAERAAAEEQEATKKYNGPVGKNPWGTIAEDWASHGRKGEKDFSEELGELANLVGGKKLPIFNRIGKVVDQSNEESDKPNFSNELKKSNPAQKYPIITRRVPQDWDAPENDDGVVVTSFRLDNEDNGPRKRKNSGSNQEGEKDIKWSKRLKRPRMHMVADEIESKISAKTRLYKGIQRRIDRPEVRKSFGSDQIEIFEEEEEENDSLHRPDQSRRRSEPIIGDKNETLTMSVKIHNSNSKKDFSGVRMSERFPTRKGISASLRQRLGDFGNKQNFDHEKSRDNIHSMGGAKNNISLKKQNVSGGYNSCDSLEMDEGDDLRGELDGHHAANMVIQVTQSPKQMEGQGLLQNDSGSDAEMEDDRRQESHIASVVAKIKTEKKGRPNTTSQLKDRNQRELATHRIGERQDRDQRREREKDDRRKRETNKEKEIAEREKLRKERHKHIDQRNSQQYREKEETRLDHSSRQMSRENRREERWRDNSTDRSHRKKDRPMRIKKEKLSDDEIKKKGRSRQNSSSDDSSSSSSSSSSDESSSSSSSSDSDSSDSSSSSGSSTDESKSKRNEGPIRKRQKLTAKLANKGRSGVYGRSSLGSSKVSSKRAMDERKGVGRSSKDMARSRNNQDKSTETISKVASSRKDTSSSKRSDNSGIHDKLKDYLKKAKERRKREKDDSD